MGCGFSSDSSVAPTKTHRRRLQHPPASVYRTPDAAATVGHRPPAEPGEPRDSAVVPPGVVPDCDSETCSPTLSAKAVGALESRPSKQARDGKHRLRQWVLVDAQQADAAVSPLADSDLDASASSSSSSSSSLSSTPVGSDEAGRRHSLSDGVGL